MCTVNCQFDVDPVTLCTVCPQVCVTSCFTVMMGSDCMGGVLRIKVPTRLTYLNLWIILKNYKNKKMVLSENGALFTHNFQTMSPQSTPVLGHLEWKKLYSFFNQNTLERWAVEKVPFSMLLAWASGGMSCECLRPWKCSYLKPTITRRLMIGLLFIPYIQLPRWPFDMI